jgi:DNA-binding response OmpR family regulator
MNSQMVAMRVLLVENDLHLRPVVARLMRCFGFDSVAEAGDGKEALSQLEGQSVDLILTDCDMPGMDGIDLTRKLRQRGDTTPIIMLSGRDDAKIVAKARRAGVSDYIQKPIDAKALSASIDRALGEHRIKKHGN